MSSAGAGGERRIATWLAVVAALAYLPFNHCHFSGTDEMGVFEPAQELYLRGDMAVEEGKHRFAGRDGRIYSHFAIGQSILVIPFLAVGDALGRWREVFLQALVGPAFQPDGQHVLRRRRRIRHAQRFRDRWRRSAIWRRADKLLPVPCWNSAVVRGATR